MSSEAWLIRKAKKGDTKAYGELIQLHKDYFYRNAFCYVKNVDLAGDVFQEAVTIGMLSIKDLKNPNYFRTWMTRIIYNCANEMFRKAEREIGSLDAEIRDGAGGKARRRQEGQGLGRCGCHPCAAHRDGLGREGYRSGSPAEQAVI